MSTRTPAAILLGLLLLVPLVGSQSSPAGVQQTRVDLWIPAVGQREDGTLFGVASALTVTMQSPGTGEVFLSTQPLTQIDMQGSARLAVDTASSITGLSASNADFFFSVRTPSVTIGGPSAGAAMAVAIVALLEGWEIRDDVVMTGMINPDGSIGPIGGVPQKLEAADSVGATRFLIPLGQSQAVSVDAEGNEEVVDLRDVGPDQYGVEVEEVADLYDAVTPFTGKQLVRPEPSRDPRLDAEYGSITRNLADTLTGQTAERLEDLEARAEDVDAGAGDAQTIEEQLTLAGQRLESARGAQEDGHQYLASSLAFQGLVALDYAEALIRFYESGDPVEAYVADYLDQTDSLLAEVAEDIVVEYPIAAARLDSQGAAEQRLIEAQASNVQAREAFRGSEHGTALQASSFARERAESARWWYSIGDQVGRAAPEPTISQASLEALTAKYRDTAELELSYALLISDETPNIVAAQVSYERSAAAVEEGLHAAALFELVHVLAQTSTSLVALAGEEPVRQRLDAVEKSAAYQIELAQGEGTPPVYAIALLELAASRVAEDPVGAYASYSTARISAGASLQAAGITAPAPNVIDAPQAETEGLGRLISVPVLGFLLALAVGAILLLIVWGAQNRYTPPPPPPPLRTLPPAQLLWTPPPPAAPPPPPFIPEAAPPPVLAPPTAVSAAPVAPAPEPATVPGVEPKKPVRRRAPARKAAPAKPRRKPPPKA